MSVVYSDQDFGRHPSYQHLSASGQTCDASHASHGCDGCVLYIMPYLYTYLMSAYQIMFIIWETVGSFATIIRLLREPDKRYYIDARHKSTQSRDYLSQTIVIHIEECTVSDCSDASLARCETNARQRDSTAVRRR